MPSTNPKPIKKWERRSDARPAELIAAALRLFAERGFAGTRLEEVAARAGVSKATVYLYFESKEKLFEAVVRATITPSLAQLDSLVDAFEGPTADLVRAMGAVLEAALDGPLPSIAKMIVSESGNFPALARFWGDAVLARGMAVIQRVIRRGMERGEFRRVDPASVAPLFVAPVLLLGLFEQSLAPHMSIKLDRHAVISAHVETLLRGLAADDAGKKGKR